MSTTDQRVTAVALLLALAGGTLVGTWAARTEEQPTPVVTVTVPAWADGCGSDADCADMERSLNAAGLHLTGGGGVSPSPDEDQSGWNCLTMGNRTCGPSWLPITVELTDALAEGDDTAPENATTRQWVACLIQPGETSVIVCPDGYVTTQ